MKQFYQLKNRAMLALIALLAGFSASAQTVLIDPLTDGGFETGSTFAANGWSVSNITDNPWTVGTAVSSGAIAGNSAYISNDAGVSNAYTNTTIANNFFWRDVTVPAGETKILLNFNWICQGESTWDNWQVFVAPTTVVPASTTTYPGSGATNVPAGIAGATFVGNGNLQGTTQSSTYLLPSSLAGTTFRLIFSWKNDGSGGAQPPAVLDNISLVSSVPGTFVSITTGNWSSPSTWDAAAVPTALDNVVISTADVVTLDLAGQSANNVTVNGTLAFGTTPTSFTANGNLTVNSTGTFNVFNGTTGKNLTVTGNITNDGIIDLSKGTNTTTSVLTLNGTAVQTLSGTGTFATGVIRNVTFNNTNTSIPNIVWSMNNLSVGGALVFTNGKVDLGTNKLTLGTGTATGTGAGAVGSLTAPAGQGFLPNGTFVRNWATASTGTSITAGTDPTNSTSRYPFLNTTGANRAVYLTRASGGTVGGQLSVKYIDGSGTSAASIVDGAYTVDQVYNGYWVVSSEGTGITTASYGAYLLAPGAYAAINGNSHIVGAAAALSGTNQNGTTTPAAYRTGISLADLTSATGLHIGINSADLVVACSGTPSPGAVTATPSTVNILQSFTLTLPGVVGISGLTYQWQSSTDGITYTDISGATGVSYTGSESVDTYYQCVVTCTASGLSAAATAVQVTTNPVINMVNGSATVCSTSFYDAGGSAANYNNNEDYTLTLYPSTAGSVLQVVFSSFAVETCCDNLTIYNGNSTGAPLIGTYTASPGTILSTAVDGSLTFVWHSDVSTTNTGWSAATNCVSPCSGTPTAGTTSPASNPVCSGVPFVLSLSGADVAVGLTYQWQSSSDGITYTDISGATAATYSASQAASTYYQCVVTCTNGGASATSTPVQVTMNTPTNCYCTSAAGGTSFEYIGGVVATGGINNTGTTHTTYSDFTATQISTVYQGQVVTATISSGGTWYTSDAAYIFIDFNQDGDFADAGENVGTATGSTSPYTINFTIPAGAMLGTTRMRVKFGDTGGSTAFNSDPCQTGYSYGETEDYGIVITTPPACPPPSGLAAGSITTTGASLSWSCTSCTGTFSLEYGPTGFTPGSGITVSPANSPVAVSGLTASTGYEFYVIQDCGGGSFSTPTGPFAFTTKMAGDDVCDAIPLLMGSNGPYDNTTATTQTGEPAPPANGCGVQNGWCNTGLENTMWFTFVAPASGRVSVQSPGFDTQLAVWAASDCNSILSGGATLIGANDDDPNSATDGGVSYSSMITPINCLTPGATYYVQLDGYSGTTGSTPIVLTDLGVADASFTGLNSTYCSNATAATLTPATSGGVFSGTGVTGSSFDPAAVGAGTFVIKYKLTACDSTLQTVTVYPTVTGSQTLSICNGTSLTVGTSTYNMDGTYTDVLTSFRGCDSTVTTNLTVLPAIANTQTVSICNGTSLTVGTSTYNADGTYTDVLTSYQGCDSTVTTNLTVLPAIANTQTLTICNGTSVTVGTSTYNADGTYTDVLTSYQGCDSTVTTNLTVLPAIANTQTVSICNGTSFTVGTNTYNTDGTYTDVFTSYQGCDSTVTTNLTVLPVITATQTVSICNGTSLTVGTNTYSADGTYTDVLTSYQGCDSTLTTNLTVLPVLSGTQTVSICNGTSLTVGTSTYNADGTYTDVLTSYQGCDSTVTTNLTVLPAIDLTTSVSGHVITSNATSATYQWMDCNTNAIIAGETNQTYTAVNNGDYTVIVTVGACTDTSACVNMDFTGIAELAGESVQIYPNPGNGQFTLSIAGANFTQITIAVVDIQGKVVYSESDKANTTGFSKTMNLENLAKGVYYLKLTADNFAKIEKLIIQ